MRTARDNLWLDTSYGPGPPLWGEHDADVAVLGAGYTGLGAAYFIKKRFPEKRVVVLESQYVGFGSSGRNSGGVSGVLGHNFRNLKRKYGVEKSARLQGLMAESFAIVEGLIREYKIACDYEKTGRMVVAETEKQKRLLAEEVEACQEAGGVATWLDKAEARSRLGSVNVQAAVRYPNEGIADPVKFLRGMRGVVDSLGVEIYEHSPCTHIEAGPKLSLYTPGGSVRADAMVLATQAYPNPLKLLHYRVLPFYVYNIATEPLSPQQMDELQLPGRENTFNATNLYWAVRPTADNRLVFTKCNALYFYHIDRDYSHCPRAYRSHHRLLVRKFPFLSGIRVTHQWGGADRHYPGLSAFARLYGKAPEHLLQRRIQRTGIGLRPARREDDRGPDGGREVGTNDPHADQQAPPRGALGTPHLHGVQDVQTTFQPVGQAAGTGCLIQRFRSTPVNGRTPCLNARVGEPARLRASCAASSQSPCRPVPPAARLGETR